MVKGLFHENRSISGKKTLNKGSILLLVLAVLALLSLLATAMVSIQSMSRQESARYIEKVEAKLLAHAGFERAIAELQSNPFSQDIRYLGRDVNPDNEAEPADLDGNGQIDPWENDTKNVPVEYALSPSYAYRDIARSPNEEEPEIIQPKTIKIERPGINESVLEVGISGFVSAGKYMKNGNVYSVKVEDLQSKIYINDGLNLYGGNQSSVSQNLKRIINALAAHPDVLGTNAPKELGQKIIDSRPPEGFRSMYDVRRAIMGQFGVAEGKDIYKKLEPYVTVHAWIDKNVVNPVPLSNEVYDKYPVFYYRRGDDADVGSGPAVVSGIKNKPYINIDLAPEGYVTDVHTFRRGRGKNAMNEYRFNAMPERGGVSESLRWFDPYYTSGITMDVHNAIYGLDELFPQYVEVVHRAPVNINNASEPVLTALLHEVSGFFVMERRRFAPYSPSPSDISIETSSKFQDATVNHSITIPQKYKSWEYNAYSYDTGGYTMDLGTDLITVKSDADAFGYLYRTVPLRIPGSLETGVAKADQYIDAVRVARHIIAAREQSNYEDINYKYLGFSGRFKRWSQFHRFVDYLVEREVIRDRRNIYWNYLTDPEGDWGEKSVKKYPYDLSDPAQQEFASYAIADALKANFNPNMHLNEANPDENLWLRVDKTDLIVNSTEFCFTPMGYFAIESVGRILKPSKPDSGAAVAAGVFDTEVIEISREKVYGVVKAYDAYRETSQRHFAQGVVSDKAGMEPTNSGKGLEVGPEIANSIAVRGKEGTYTLGDNYSDYNVELELADDGYKGESIKKLKSSGRNWTGWGAEYDGYIQLSTLGGIDDFGGGKGELVQTPPGSPHWPTSEIAQFEGLHAHFQFDFRAHHHASSIQLGDNFRNEASALDLSSDIMIDKFDPAFIDPEFGRVLEIRDYKPVMDRYLNKRQVRFPQIATYGKVERTVNYSDDNKSLPGPYDSGFEHRLARSFRLNKVDRRGQTKEGIEMPTLTTYAPTDLRIDGAYVERNNGLSYWVDEGVSMFTYGGAASMWIKPSFFPEYTGKVRKLFSYDRWHMTNYTYRNPNMFSLMFMPAHDSPPGLAPDNEVLTPSYIGALTTNKMAKPVEGYGANGVFAFRPSSFVAGIYMHQAGGSLEDWEYDEMSLRESLWDNNATHVIDMEVFYNTPALNHNLHAGLSSGIKGKTGTTVTQRGNIDYLDSNRWTHVVWSWLILLGGSSSPAKAKNGKRPRNDDIDTTITLSGALDASGMVGLVIKRDDRPVKRDSRRDMIRSKLDSEYMFVPVTNPEHRLKVYVNGKEFTLGASGVQLPAEGERGLYSSGGRSPIFSIHSMKDPGAGRGFSPLSPNSSSNMWTANTFRIGESSYHGFPGGLSGSKDSLIWQRNFSGDFTVDEFYLYGSAQESDSGRTAELLSIEDVLKGIYNKGRYYVPRISSAVSSDCVFRSDKIILSDVKGRGQSERNNRVIGLQWTWYAEGYSDDIFMPYINNYNDPAGQTMSIQSHNVTMEGRKVVPVRLMDGSGSEAIKVTLSKYSEDGMKKELIGEFADSGQSYIESTDGVGIIKSGETIEYSVDFRIDSLDPLNTTFLTTPVFDDITIFYTGGVEILFYSDLEV